MVLVKVFENSQETNHSASVKASCSDQPDRSVMVKIPDIAGPIRLVDDIWEWSIRKA